MPKKTNTTTRKKHAIDALEAARAVHVASWEKLGDIIALKKRLGRRYTSELRKKTAASRRISVLNSRLLDVRAAQTIIRAPTLAEVRAVTRLVNRVKSLAIRQATLSAAFTTIKNSMRSSSSTAAKVRLG